MMEKRQRLPAIVKPEASRLAIERPLGIHRIVTQVYFQMRMSAHRLLLKMTIVENHIRIL